jgi:hypothetical protein
MRMRSVILEKLRQAWSEKIMEHDLGHDQVTIQVRPLKPEEVIGKPTRNGYPLLRGKEVMIQADLRGTVGQAFTDQPSSYAGQLAQLSKLPADTNATRALLVAGINATYAFLGSVKGTRHCRDSGPETCAAGIADHLAQSHDLETKVLLIGFQPAITSHLAKMFRMFRVTDMDPENVGKIKEGVAVEPHEHNMKAIEWSDIVLATGSTLVNGSIDDIVVWTRDKPLYFYGVTIGAAAYELNLNRVCFERT